MYVSIICRNFFWIADNRSIKALLYGELEEGSRKIGRPFFRYEGAIKEISRRRWSNSMQTRKGTVT